jgi:hypothetical protein
MAKKSKKRGFGKKKRAVKKTRPRKRAAAKKKKPLKISKGKRGLRVRTTDTPVAKSAPQFTSTSFDPNKGSYVEFIVEYDDGRKESMFIDNSTLSGGDHVAKIVARDGQNEGILAAGKIKKVTRKS